MIYAVSVFASRRQHYIIPLFLNGLCRGAEGVAFAFYKFMQWLY